MGQDSKKEVVAAITLALYEYQGYTMHVQESGVLTIGGANTDWNSKLRLQRHAPEHNF